MTSTITEFVITHGGAVGDVQPVDWLPNVDEYLLSGTDSGPVFTVNGMLDGCENPYPSPVACISGPLPDDPYGANSDDYVVVNYASYPSLDVDLAHAKFYLRADADNVLAESNTEMDWAHRIVYP